MNITTNVHGVTKIEIGVPRQLSNSQTWIRDITFHTADGSVEVTAFADNGDDIRLQFEDIDD